MKPCLPCCAGCVSGSGVLGTPGGPLRADRSKPRRILGQKRLELGRSPPCECATCPTRAQASSVAGFSPPPAESLRALRVACRRNVSEVHLAPATVDDVSATGGYYHKRSRPRSSLGEQGEVSEWLKEPHSKSNRCIEDPQNRAKEAVFEGLLLCFCQSFCQL